MASLVGEIQTSLFALNTLDSYSLIALRQGSGKSVVFALLSRGRLGLRTRLLVVTVPAVCPNQN